MTAISALFSAIKNTYIQQREAKKSIKEIGLDKVIQKNRFYGKRKPQILTAVHG